MARDALALSLALGAGVPLADAVEIERARLLMGTTLRVVVQAEDERAAVASAEAAFDAVARVEDVLSTWRPEAQLSRANAAAAMGRAELTPELASWLDVALRHARDTGGAFDPTVGPLIDAWCLRAEGCVPDAVRLAHARALVGVERVDFDAASRSLRLPGRGAWIDSGGFGKGAALDRAAAALRDRGITAALLDFGGQLLAIGAPEGEDTWRVAIADPGNRHAPALELRLRNASASTSAQSEQSFRVEGGRRVGHVLDPRSGGPVSFAGSATVVSAGALEADALSTALLVLGPRDGLAWIRRHRPDLAAAWLEPLPDARLRLTTSTTFSSLVIHDRTRQ
jgi:thiamine biosynthesis lipoprotein